MRGIYRDFDHTLTYAFVIVFNDL